MILSSLRAHRRVRLGGRVLIGRSHKCDLVLDEPRASGEHAALSWTGTRWELRDLGSRNGTWVDGERLESGAARPLSHDSRIGFGSADEVWTLVSAKPPVPAAEHLVTHHIVEGTTELLALPDEDAPAACVVRGASGWLLEGDADARPVEDGDVVEIAGAPWRLFLPQDLARTEADGAPPLSLDAATLEFAVSRDEEFVSLSLIDGERSLELRPRAHLYLLLTLARLRRQDRDAGELPETSQGWVHQTDLARMLDTSEPKIDVDIYRARQQLVEAGVQGASGIVERRARTRQLRLGTARSLIRGL